MVVLGDVDGDGDKDAFISYYSLPNRLWLNDGSGVFTRVETEFGGNNSTEMELADFNNDSYLDLYLCLREQENEIWFNDGNGNFTNGTQLFGDINGYDHVSVKDIENDGDIDFAIANSVDGVKIWLNQNNTGIFEEAGPYFETGTTRIEFIDANLDGNYDLITGNQTTGNKLWMNDGNNNFSSLGNVFGDSQLFSVKCGKLDNDYDYDVILGKNVSQGGNEIYFNESNNVDIEDNYELSIMNYELEQNYPNPFNPVTKIRYQLAVNSEQLAKIVVHNAMGQQVWSSPITDHSSLVTGSILFDGSKFNSGIYYYSLVVDNKVIGTKSMVLIK